MRCWQLYIGEKGSKHPDGTLSLRGTPETPGMLQVGWSKTVDRSYNGTDLPHPIQVLRQDQTAAENL